MDTGHRKNKSGFSTAGIDENRSSVHTQRVSGDDGYYFSRDRGRCRFRSTLWFATVIWMLEITVMLMYSGCDGFTPGKCHSPKPFSLMQPEPQEHYFRHLGLAMTSKSANSISSTVPTKEDNDKSGETLSSILSTQSTSYSLKLPSPRKSRRRQAWNFLKKKFFFWNGTVDESSNVTETALNFSYDYDVIELTNGANGANGASTSKTTGIMLIHPIGVGIARWYYQRLVSSLIAKQVNAGEHLVVVVPDLLGSGSACNATAGTEIVNKFPLFNISDWTDQVEALMSSVEAAAKNSYGGNIDEWCVVANGGCSPIALQLAERKKILEKNDHLGVPVTNLVLSSVPRLPFFLKNETTNDARKVAKSYKTLSGVPGNLFWWYSCRNKGAFIQSFSEQNLIADPKNLGPTWRSNCYETAISFGGKGRYATFSFLAGTLQDGCLPSLGAIKDTPLKINIIKGSDFRRNRARSWFWQKPRKMKSKTSEARRISMPNDTTVATIPDERIDKPYDTFRDYVEKNGNGGREIVIGGRISLAHEDPRGYADAILDFLSSS